jgi:biopolymer transport protein ExbD
MLVLLILFMVTSSVSLESGLDVDLPKTSSGTEAKGPDAVIVSLDQDGRIAVQGQIVAFEELETVIRSALNTVKTTLVIFEGDQTSELGRTIEIMDVAKRAGADKFAIATEKKL